LTENLYDNIDDLLVKVVLGEATEEELRYVQGWLAVSNGNKRYFDDFKRIWDESRNLAYRSTVNEEAAWSGFKQRISADKKSRMPDFDLPLTDEDGSLYGEGQLEENKAGDHSGEGKVVRLINRRKYAWLRVAAILVTVFTASWLYYTFSYKPSQFLSFRSGAQVLSDTLPEGSVVTLNKQSSIRYKRQFAGDLRKVDMEGEAFFKVAQDKNKPFVVHTNGVVIKVLGTSFNVRTAAGGTEVIVETGMVEITRGGQTVRVGAHEKVLIGKNISAPVKEVNTDELYNYYRTNEFECDGTPLWRLVDKLNEVYKANIVIGDTRLREKLLTTTFQGESLDSILDVIAKTFGITVVRSGQEIILK
jgi:transmembrane sensor